ncbi:unnamed protein product [Spodoptera littoralis]|uniref:SEC63 domain-containing protein n=1 Tax=Spodoptera littoralis TaxID=7109 RepID=A0A9P0I0W8_SPOLI|nr:unnamed protein product [Spodoptera littoralis]CAH1638110.1 unnamed protein product [Spodoptera littoralis]
MHLRVDERRCLNLLNRNQAAATIRFPMKGKISTRQMKLNCIIQAVLGCLPIPDPSLNQEAMKIMRTADRVCKCLVTYVTRPDLVSQQPMFFSAVLNSILLAKCISAHLWENSPYVSKQLKGIGPTFSTLLATAGKVNFILLEESHPRDLERIMNKGAPAGNVLRKQISLLPKYQLTMIPVDEKTVTLQLLLINQAYLAENMDNLTAGERHKSYIIVGDSNNHLLLLAAFKDKDLISVFDGTISHEIRRKHNFEHKIFAHCVSSSFVGIDAQAEYLFNDLEPFLGGPNTQKNSIQKNPVSNKKVNERQTCITDTFKERKRKNTDAIEKSKEKKKRDSAMIESFKYLKQSFETASKNVNQRVNHQMNTNKESTNNITLGHSEPSNSNCKDSWNTRQNNTPNPTTILNVCSEEMDSDEFIDERKIDSILNEIENEMNKDKPNSNDSKARFRDNVNTAFNKSTHSLNSLTNLFPTTKSTNYSTSAIRKRKPVTTKSNYNFIELLERKLSLSDNEDVIEVPQKDNGFSETIKNHIQKYLTKTKTTIPDKNLEILTILDDPQNELPDDGEMNRTLLLEELTNPVREPCPKYESKEILGQSDTIQNREVQKANNIECYIDVNDCETIENAKPERERELPNYNTNMKQLTDFSDKNIIVLDDENYKTDKTNDEHYEVKDNYMQVIESKNDTEVNNCNEMNQNDVQFIKNDEIEPKSMYKTDVNIISPTTEKVQCPGINNTKNSTIDKSLDVNGSVLSKPNIDTERVEDNFDESLKHISRQIVPLNINQLVANNKTLLTDGINREYLATNISSDQTDCAPSESSFISPPCSNLPNETQSTSNYFSKNIETDQRKAKFVQRFTYVASKIDVCTKQTPEYSMQVIKKMKMDVDITAIVSRKNDSFQNSRADCEQTSNDNIKMIELLKQNNTNREDDEIISARNNERNHKSNIIFPPMHISTFDSLAILPNEGSLNANSNVKGTIKEPVPDHNLMGTKNVSNDKVNDALSNNSEHLEANYNCDNLSANIRQTEYENACVGGNKIQNILEKYSKKLSTNLSKPLTPSCSNITRPGYNSAPKIKARKPFKITDLHKLHATIPDTIVENKTEVQKELLQSPKLNLFVDVTKIPEKFNRNEFTDNASMQFQDISHCGSLIEMDLEPINEYLSPKIDLEPKAYKIDQSMFNPKKLLQCVADDEHEIVPPPPEFCDDISYSPEEDLSTCGRNELLTSQLNDFANNDEACNENIFDDNIGTDLTPSKEIETWVLSQEDDDRNSNMSLNTSPVKSYTVMRKNCSNNSNFSYKNIMSRHAKLGQFRFSQKNKFKAKK